MSRGKHRKLYYVPGLISLVVVPLLFVFSSEKQLQRLDQRVIEVNALYPDLLEQFPLPQRSYKAVRLSGDDTYDKPAIEKAKAFIREIYAKEDTINGVHFTFEDSMSYATYVNLLNFFSMDSIKTYGIYDNNIWVLHPPKPKFGEALYNDYVIICGNSYLYSGYNASQELDLLESINHYITTYLAGIAKLWLSITLLFIMIILTAARVYKAIKASAI